MKILLISLCFGFFLVLFLRMFYELKSKIPLATLPDPDAFTDTMNGRACEYYVIQSSNGTKAAFSTYGARMVRLLVPTIKGSSVAVVQGYDSLCQYIHSVDSLEGALIGSYGKQHWNAIQQNDSTLSLMYAKVNLICEVGNNTFSISSNQVEDSLLPKPQLFFNWDKKFTISNYSTQNGFKKTSFKFHKVY